MPLRSPIHSTLITRAARAVLRPMGLTQKGRSRTWLDDHGWWVCVIEFQPSSWSRGSYLNVGCCWLWDVKNYLSFDHGSRVEGFTPFEDETQFTAVAISLAEHAAAEVNKYRNLFPDVHAVADYYSHNPPTAFWPLLHAAIACGLSGSIEPSQKFFSAFIAHDDNRDWALTAKAHAAKISAIASNTLQFQAAIQGHVHQTRALLKLPPTSIEFPEPPSSLAR